MNAVTRHRRVAVKACHASSKTWTAARLALWWALTKPDGIVVTTASSWVQVERLLWAEIHEALGLSRVGFPGANKTELTFGPKNFIIGLSTNLGERFRGFPRANLLIIMDEATGIRGEIWEELPGIMAGGNVHVLALGNPTVPGGPFHDAFTVERELWKTFTISAFTTPNFAELTRRPGSVETYLKRLDRLDDDELLDNERPYLISKDWVQERAETWGVDNPRFQSRALGEFPEQAEDALISLAWLENAKHREPEPDNKKRLVRVGIDVAGPGEDETVVYVVQGNNVIALGAFNDRDARGPVLRFLQPWGRRIEVANYDSIGMGHYFGPHLKDHGISTVGVDVSMPPRDRRTFANLKAELCWALRERFQAGEVAGLTDERTIAQSSTILWKETPGGKIIIESKADARSRGIKSPDRFEALMLAFAPHISHKKKRVKRVTFGRRASSLRKAR